MASSWHRPQETVWYWRALAAAIFSRWGPWRSHGVGEAVTRTSQANLAPSGARAMRSARLQTSAAVKTNCSVWACHPADHFCGMASRHRSLTKQLKLAIEVGNCKDWPQTTCHNETETRTSASSRKLEPTLTAPMITDSVNKSLQCCTVVRWCLPFAGQQLHGCIFELLLVFVVM